MSTSLVKRSLISHLAPFSPVSRGYRTLRNMLEHSQSKPNSESKPEPKSEQEPQVILVTSAEPREGKTTTAVNLAIAYAQADRKVLLIDGNVYRPSIHTIFSLPNDTGLSSLSFRQRPLEELAQDSGIGHLSVLTSGPYLSASANPLHPSRLGVMLESARERFDRIVIDSPALLSLTDMSILAVQSDTALLVVHAVHSRWDQAVKAQKLLRQLDVPIAGCVLNHAKAISGRDYYDHATARYS